VVEALRTARCDVRVPALAGGQAQLDRLYDFESRRMLELVRHDDDPRPKLPCDPQRVAGEMRPPIPGTALLVLPHRCAQRARPRCDRFEAAELVAQENCARPEPRGRVSGVALVVGKAPGGHVEGQPADLVGQQLREPDVAVRPVAIPSGPFDATAPMTMGGSGNSVTVPAGVIWPILLPRNSVNQRLPSGPGVIQNGMGPTTGGVVIGNSVTTPAGVMRPIPRLISVNQRFPSGPDVIPRGSAGRPERPD